jgi:hypothetical protein
MQAFKISIPAVIFALICLQACVSKKDFDHCDGKLVPKIKVDSVVIAGNAINLSVTGIDNIYTCNWAGPNKFYSHEFSPVIYNATGANAGRYTVDVVTKDGCIYTASTDSVIIQSVQPPCTLTNNYAEFTNTFDVTFYSTSGGVSGGSYFVSANGSTGDLTMEFAGVDKPVNGIYDIQPFGGNWARGNVRVQISNLGALWNTGSGKVYVNNVNGKIVVSFCGVPFSYNNLRTTVNCKVTI